MPITAKMSGLNVNLIKLAKKLGKQPMAATLIIKVTVAVRSHQVASVRVR